MKDGGQSCHKWSVEADVESLAWNPHNEHSFVVSETYSCFLHINPFICVV